MTADSEECRTGEKASRVMVMQGSLLWLAQLKLLVQKGNKHITRQIIIMLYLVGL